MILEREVSWGTQLVVRPSCGHPVVILPAWVAKDGRFLGVLECTFCGRRYEGVVLKDWVMNL